MGKVTGIMNEYARTEMMRDGVGLIPDFYNIPFLIDPINLISNNQADGGNFEVQPGVGGNLGTILLGKGRNNNQMATEVVDFLKAQGVQTVVDDFDLTWMQLGHTDEVVSFASTSSNRARIASPETAWALLVIADRMGGAALSMLQGMNGLPANGVTVDDVLRGPSAANVRAINFNSGTGYSEKLLNIRTSLGFTSPVSTPLSGAGAPANVLRRAGYLDVFDTLYNYGDEVEWKLSFSNADEFTIEHRKVGTTNWAADGSGKCSEDSVAASNAIYILKEWWDATKVTAQGHEVTFITKPSPDMIEMPVLFGSTGFGAKAATNNVINSIVDGDTLFVARTYGPAVWPGQPGGPNRDIFEFYVEEAAHKAGFTTVYFNEERDYHTGTGSIHCASNVLRLIPDQAAEKWWNNL